VAQGEPVANPDGHGKPVSNLTLRIASAAVMAPLAVGAAYVGDWPFALFWAIASIAVLWEWITLVAGPHNRVMFISCASSLAVSAVIVWHGRPIAAVLLLGLGILAAVILAPRTQRAWIAGGVGYAGALLLAPILLRGAGRDGFVAIVLLFSVVWSTDVFGYFVGRAIGGPKLLPSVSPKKTWSGAIAGATGAIVAALIVAAAFGGFRLTAIAVVALLLSIVSQGGDLLESSIKRHFGAKDASSLIPGHGGVMDRLDGFWAAALLALLIGLARGGFDDTAGGLLNW
jgi:phosphatidate cytidylyltransferase